MGTRGKPCRGGSGGHIPRTLPRAAGSCTGCPRGNSGLRGGYCHSACQLLGLDPWRRLECGRKKCGVTPSRRMECGVTPSGWMECGVTPSGRRISLKGAVAHFFLSFFLPFSFLTQQLVCPLSRIEASCHNPFSLVQSRPPPRAALVLSDPVLGRHSAPFLSCPILSSAAAARRSCPVRSCPRPPPRADLVLVPLPKALSARLLQR